jgi:poly-gamma-glutamate synthesis protein (capsule biosynthesis protein)
MSWRSICILGLVLASLNGCSNRGLRKQHSVAAPNATLALLGDVMLGRGVQPSSDTFSYLEPYLASADIALANLESPLTASPGRKDALYVLCAPPAYAAYLVDAGLDILSLANNHVDDCGAQGAADTRSILESAGLDYAASRHQPVFRTVNDMLLAFLAFDATGAFDLPAAAGAVTKAREAGAVVIVSMHWGLEYQFGPTQEQIEIASQLSRAGASLIWGHHPHVLQPATWIEGGKTLVLYSLGNALFDQHGLEGTRRSALAVVTIDQDGAGRYEAVPFVIDVARSKIERPDHDESRLILKYFPDSQGP